MPMILFKAFSALLSYPTADMRAALPDIAAVVDASSLISEREKRGLNALIGELGEGDLLSAEARYVDLFDRGRALSLHLFEHLHGESRDRGTAMVELKRLYENAGFDLVGQELPDYLPVLLEYLSCRDMDEAHDILADCAHILTSIARSLIARQSRYAAVPQALLVIAGEKPVNAAEIKPVKEDRAALDRDWAEQPAFAEPAGDRPKP
ncbi:nitrate reductase molybdenum cofactor assembly chaperone [Mesorhizobium xinjiangense]|uniref:nitrate reductase molybdenum cofactor assembly chaperone n=1 Tax=Mesorhizobium xinjiangense TaxID=2678685 RepID=UPI0012ED10A8|nr:nitrate reductase molybdenum cofactor assembly chaperone [Mesorhizobium xinjiangense]